MQDLKKLYIWMLFWFVKNSMSSQHLSHMSVSWIKVSKGGSGQELTLANDSSLLSSFLFMLHAWNFSLTHIYPQRLRDETKTFRSMCRQVHCRILFYDPLSETQNKPHPWQSASENTGNTKLLEFYASSHCVYPVDWEREHFLYLEVYNIPRFKTLGFLFQKF